MKYRIPEADQRQDSGAIPLLLAVDGGGSKTTALLATLDRTGEVQILGRGQSGASNLRLAGKKLALSNLDLAINSAFDAAGSLPRQVETAVLALAGSTHADIHEEVHQWGAKRELTKELELVHDIYPLIYASNDNGRGIALIVGTGSVAMGMNSAGKTVVRGGWGHWFGDEGSGYDLGCKALAAIARASDNIGEPTSLTAMVLEKYKISKPRLILNELTLSQDIHCEVAALAPLVLRAASSADKVAEGIVDNAVQAVIKLVTAVAGELGFKQAYPLVLAGGVICNSQLFQTRFRESLSQQAITAGSIRVIKEPVTACLEMARVNYLSMIGH